MRSRAEAAEARAELAETRSRELLGEVGEWRRRGEVAEEEGLAA